MITLILPLNDRITQCMPLDSEPKAINNDDDIISLQFNVGRDDPIDRIFCTLPQYQEPEEKFVYLGSANTSKGIFDIFEIIMV